MYYPMNTYTHTRSLFFHTYTLVATFPSSPKKSEKCPETRPSSLISIYYYYNYTHYMSYFTVFETKTKSSFFLYKSQHVNFFFPENQKIKKKKTENQTKTVTLKRMLNNRDTYLI